MVHFVHAVGLVALHHLTLTFVTHALPGSSNVCAHAFAFTTHFPFTFICAAFKRLHVHGTRQHAHV